MDIKQTLLNFNETLKSNPELSDDELLNKFPELNKDSLSAAFDYSATLDSGKYKSEVEFEDKFPEFFPVKKKELDGQTLPEVTVKSTSKSQSQLGQPAQTPTSVSNSSLSVSQPSLATEVDYSPLSTEDLSNKYKELKTLADQYKSNIDKFKAEGDSGKIRLSGTANEYNKIIGELNRSIQNCLGVKIVEIGDFESDRGTLYFSKVDHPQPFEFNVLSSGEKEVIDILFDLYLRKD